MIGVNFKKKVLYILLILVLFLYSLVSKIYLIRTVLFHKHEEILCMQGAKPVALPAYYTIENMVSAWSSILSVPGPKDPPYMINLWLYEFSSPCAWIIHEILLPFVGSLVFSFVSIMFLRLFTEDNGKSNNFIIYTLSGFGGGLVYESILLSPWIDNWTESFRSLLPIALFLALRVFKEISNKRKFMAFSLLTALTIAGLYDVRIILSSITIILLLYILQLIVNKSFLMNYKKGIILTLIIILFGSIILGFIPRFMSIILKESNPFNGIRALTLPIIVGNYDLPSSFGFPFPLIAQFRITHILAFIFIAFSMGLCLLNAGSRNNRRYKLVKIIPILTSILLLLSLIIYYKSPLKVIQEYLVKFTLLNTDVGVLFRTPRFFVTINSVILSLLVSSSLYLIITQIKVKKGSKLKAIMKSMTLLLIIINIFGIMIINIYTNNYESVLPPWRKTSFVPSYYINIYSFLNNKLGNSPFRVLWIPRTGKYSGEKPSWLKSICWGIGEKSLPLRTYYYYDKPMEYLYSFIMKLALSNQTEALSKVLAYIGVKYLVVNTDYWWSVMKDKTNIILLNLNKSKYFRKIYDEGKLHVFKDLKTKEAVRVVTKSIVFEGGLETLAEAIGEGVDVINVSNLLITFSDQILPLDILKETDIFIVHNKTNLLFDILTQLIYWKKVNGKIIVPTKYTLGINSTLWHPYFIANPHHAEWETFYIWALHNHVRYDLDFRNDWGFVGATRSNQLLNIPLYISKSGTYIIAIRYLANVKGGSFKVELDNLTTGIIISTSNENAFEWHLLSVHLSKGKHILTLKNEEGRNAVNIILLMTKNEYLNGLKKVSSLLRNKEIFMVGVLKKPSTSLIASQYNIKNKISFKFWTKDSIYTLKINVTSTEIRHLYIIVPEQWYPSWIAVYNRHQEKIFGFPSLFIVAYDVTLNMSNNICSLSLKTFPEISVIWGREFLILLIAFIFIIIVSITLLLSSSKLLQYLRIPTNRPRSKSNL